MINDMSPISSFTFHNIICVNCFRVIDWSSDTPPCFAILITSLVAVSSAWALLCQTLVVCISWGAFQCWLITEHGNMNVGVAHSDPNPNSTFFNSRGMWVTYIIIVIIVHYMLLSLPFLSVALAWTLTNVLHNAVRHTFIAPRTEHHK